MTDADQTAKEIRDSIIQACEYLDENTVEIKTAPAKFHGTRDKNGFVNRNAGTGELATWVLVHVPEIPEQKPDSYYERNPHVRKPTDEAVENSKEQSEMIQSVCRTATKKHHNAEYVGFANPSEGFNPPDSRVRYVNIRVSE